MGDDIFAEKPSKPEKRELDMAKQLIESLSTTFDAGKYRDEYREELLEMLETKAAGKEIVSAPTDDVEPTKAPDLMAALEESLAAVRGESKGNGGSNGASEREKSPRRSPRRQEARREEEGRGKEEGEGWLQVREPRSRSASAS